MKALFLSTARRWRSTASRANTISRNLRKQAAANASTFAVAFDIDGVLYRGSQDITPAKATILDLQKRNIPILFLTNGGGLTEARKVHLLGERLGIPTLTADQMFQSHTPMKHLNEFKHKLILAVGKNNTKQILEK
jgi:ribonucleotide monophosphatase NagD (HAD superfamily)